MYACPKECCELQCKSHLQGVIMSVELLVWYKTAHGLCTELYKQSCIGTVEAPHTVWDTTWIEPLQSNRLKAVVHVYTCPASIEFSLACVHCTDMLCWTKLSTASQRQVCELHRWTRSSKNATCMYMVIDISVDISLCVCTCVCMCACVHACVCVCV